MRQGEESSHQQAEMSAGRLAPSAYLRPLANLVGRGFSLLQFPGKHRVVERLGKVISTACPEADSSPHPPAQLAVSLSGRIERFMWAGCYEPELVAFLKWVLKPGMVFVDVGAHIGYFTVLGASLVGPEGAVYAFEPDPSCFARLVKNTARYPWVRVRQAAVGERSGEVNFLRSPRAQETGWGTIFPDEYSRAEVRVPMATLDESLSDGKLQSLALIKLDVEGAELRVLCGAERTIATFRPFVYLEINEVCLARDKKTPEDLMEFLAMRGFRLWTLPHKLANGLGSVAAVPDERKTPEPLRRRMEALPSVKR